MSRCMRCGGPLTRIDEDQGLCSAGNGPNGCFVVFLLTCQTIGAEHVLPAGDQYWDRAAWSKAYRRIAIEGRIEVTP